MYVLSMLSTSQIKQFCLSINLLFLPTHLWFRFCGTSNSNTTVVQLLSFFQCYCSSILVLAVQLTPTGHLYTNWHKTGFSSHLSKLFFFPPTVRVFPSDTLLLWEATVYDTQRWHLLQLSEQVRWCTCHSLREHPCCQQP